MFGSSVHLHKEAVLYLLGVVAKFDVSIRRKLAIANGLMTLWLGDELDDFQPGMQQRDVAIRDSKGMQIDRPRCPVIPRLIQ
jgi:hypothetical protein